MKCSIRLSDEMETLFSTPLREPPTFLSTISMVGDDRNSIVHRLIQAERKSPSRYEPTRALFRHILEGKLTFDAASTQARRLPDEVQRACACQILNTSRTFLKNESPAPITQFPNVDYVLPNGIPLAVRPLWIRHSARPRILVLHFWRSPLTQWQLSAAAAIIQSVMAREFPNQGEHEIDFISVPFMETKNAREFQRYNWSRLRPLNHAELDRFWNQFLSAWAEYQKRGPRKIDKRRPPDMFDLL